MSLTETPPPERKQSLFNMTLAIITGQVGCITLAIILAALFLGLWIDSRLATKPTFTLILVIGSIPVSLLVMIFLVRKAVSKIKTGTVRKNEQEENTRGKDR